MELPIATFSLGSLRVGVGGGAYLRFMPQPLWLAGESADPLVTQAYAANNAGAALTAYSGDAAGKMAAALDWLTK